MAKKNAPSPPKGPEKWQLVSWSKKDEQNSRIPQEWRLSSLPPASVTNYMDIPRTCGILSAEEVKITEEYDAVALAQAIKSRKLRCIDVTKAFCKVCIYAKVWDTELIRSTESSHRTSTHKLPD
jgi:amidase